MLALLAISNNYYYQIMKYQSKYKTPKRHTPNQHDRQESPPKPQTAPPTPIPNSKRQRPPISYFKQDSHSLSLMRAMERVEGESGEGGGRQERVSALLGNIMSKHKEMKRKLQGLKREKENKENASILELTFEPRLKLNPRYPIHTPMEERHKSWDEARAQHFTSIRQEAIENEVKECTFSPRLVSKPKSQRYLKDRQLKAEVVRVDRDDDEMNKLASKFIKVPHLQPNFQFREPKKQKSSIDINSIKSMIKLEIGRIAFNF